jgi:hypothetical protein
MIVKKYDNPFAGLSKPELLIVQQRSHFATCMKIAIREVKTYRRMNYPDS